MFLLNWLIINYFINYYFVVFSQMLCLFQSNFLNQLECVKVFVMGKGF